MKHNIFKRIIGIILAMVFVVSFISHFETIAYADEEQNEQESTSVQGDSFYPTPPEISGEAAVLIDADTGAVLYDRNCHERLYPASITKIMTGILAIENCSMSDKITFTSDIIDALPYDAAKLGAIVGEELTVKDSLYALFIRSYNDVAMGLAYTVSGDEQEFAKLMTEKAKAVGALDTNFVNASGLHDENHYTTSYDMAMITKYAIQNPVFMEITGTYEYTLGPTNRYFEDRYFLNRHNMLVPNRKEYYSYAVSGKTGYTDEAGRTLVTVAKKDGRTLIAVIMKSDDEHIYEDTKKLFEYGFGHFSNISVADNETRFSENKNSFFVNMKDAFVFGGTLFRITKGSYVTLPESVTINDLSYDIELFDGSSNGIIGKVKYYYLDKYMGEATIGLEISESNEEEIAPLLGENVQAEDEDVSDIPINIWILIAVIIGVILLIIWIIYLIKTKESRKRKRERKRIFRESKKRFKRRKRIRH